MNPPDLRREWPPTPVPHDPPAGLRVIQSFNCEGVHFPKDEFVSVKDPLVRRVWAEYPRLFELVGRPY